MYRSESFAIRISRDGIPDRYVKDARGQLLSFTDQRCALDHVTVLRPVLPPGDCPAVVGIEHVPRKER
jgi:hypothetical protein